MSDTPCVDGCGQDAATIERLRERLAEAEADCDRLRQECSDHLATLAHMKDAAGIALEWYDDGAIETGVDIAAYRRLRDWVHNGPRHHRTSPRSAADAPEAPGQPGRDERGSGGRTAALCIGCGWCCQSTPRERRGEAHQGCH